MFHGHGLGIGPPKQFIDSPEEIVGVCHFNLLSTQFGFSAVAHHLAINTLWSRTK